MKKMILLLGVLALSFGAFSCGGGGAGSSNTPPGENPGTPSVVQLTSSHVIAQTNSTITLHAKVLDGNGLPLKGVAVTFTNLSEPFGVLKSASSAMVANTNDLGIATASLSSTTAGFATIVAQVYNGVGIVRDRKSFYFTSRDVVAVSMNLDVDSVPGNGIFDEINDVTLFQDPPVAQPDDTVKVVATVRDAGGVPVGGGMGVSWSSSHTEAVFLRQDTQTSTFGVAEALVQVTPASIRNTDTLVNVMASADNGAANMVTLFLRPVVISPALSSVIADPPIVDTKGTSDVTAIVFLNTGAPAPDGTVVNFSTAPKTVADPSPCGTITPFAATAGGVTDPAAKFTAPLLPGTCTVTAKSGGVTIGSVDIIVIAPLTVTPDNATLTPGNTATFTITGGLPPYTVFSSDTTIATVSTVSTSAPFTFTVTAVAKGSATITVKDALGSSVTVKITVVTGPDFSITCAPTSVNSTTTSVCTLTSLNGYSSSVTLSCSPPAPTTGGSCAFAPSPVTPTASPVLTYTCGVAGGPAPFSVVASDGTLSHSFPMTATCP